MHYQWSMGRPNHFANVANFLSKQNAVAYRYPRLLSRVVLGDIGGDISDVVF